MSNIHSNTRTYFHGINDDVDNDNESNNNNIYREFFFFKLEFCVRITDRHYIILYSFNVQNYI